MKLTHMPYTVGPGFFIKVLLAKKYALPTQVINALVNFFLNFAEGNKGLVDAMEDSGDEMDEFVDDGSEQMPVMWHQTLLTLVQCYRPYLTPANCLKLKAIIKI